jgi:multiple sugar transport system ATP-binding protein
MSTPKLELIDLTKCYGKAVVNAVDGVNLTVNAGETIALLGSSGCGKSTTLNMIVGLEQPTSGDIRIDGESVANIPAGKRNVGLVFQDYAVFTSMTVRGNLAFGLEVRKTPKAEIERAVAETAELLGMADKLDISARELGGSELQRVAIGRTLVTRPSILLLDEPLSNLETAARLAMRQELRRLQHDIGLTIIYVTHDQVEAISLADRIAVMNGGQILQVADTHEICAQPSHVFVAGFLGSPPMNLLPGKIETSGDALLFRAGELRIALPRWCGNLPRRYYVGASLTLGIRPENMRITPAGAGDIAGTVMLTEPRGHESVVTVVSLGQCVKIIVPTEATPREGETVGIALDTDALAFFDDLSGQRTTALHDQGAAL